MELQIKKLVRFNAIMGAFHLIQAIAMVFLLTSVIDGVAEFEIGVVLLFQNFDFENFRLFTDQRELFDLPFALLVSSFLFISAVAHFIVVWQKDKYAKDLQLGINRFRWFEYSISSSVMIALIATLFGVRDFGSLFLIVVVNASMNLFGLDMEELNAGFEKGKVNWGPFIWGTIAGLAPWVVILSYVLGTASEVFDNIPWFVWAIVGTYFVAFNTFPINMLLQYFKVGKWKDYLYGERVYIILSLAAKSILAWLVFFGAFQPS